MNTRQHIPIFPLEAISSGLKDPAVTVSGTKRELLSKAW